MREADIQKCILDYLAAERIFAFRLNSAAFSGEHNGKKRFFKAHSLGAGAADILAIRQMPRIVYAPWTEKEIKRHRELGGLGTPGLRFDSRPDGLFQPLWIEVKNSKGRQTSEQKSFQEYVEGLGHRYVLARSVDDVIKAIGSQERVRV